jgi:undecaprenyl-diphosphatase
MTILPARMLPQSGAGALLGRHDRLLLPALILPFLALLLVATFWQPTGPDRWLVERMQDLPWGFLEFLPRLGSDVGGGRFAFYLVPAIAATVFIVLRRWELLALLGALYVLHYVCISPKMFLETYRPSPVFGVEGAGGLESFPSGHVQWATSLYGFLAYVAWRELLWTRRFVVPAYALIVLFTALGRIELGRHWPIDTVAGLLVGLLAARVLALAYEYMRAHRVTSPGETQVQ